MKGSALVLGLNRLAEVCERIELNCRKNISTGLHEAVEEVGRQFQSIQDLWDIPTE